jgi:membrane protease YdiL (CAAX protease family)
MKSILKSIGYILVFMLVQIMVQYAFSVFVVANGVKSKSEVMEYVVNNLLLISIISSFVTLGIIGFFRKTRKHSPTKLFSFHNIRRRDCLISAIAALSYSLCFGLVTYSNQFENTKLISQSSTYYSEIVPHLGLVMMVVALLLSAPIIEEYICRGIIFAELSKRFSSNITVILSAVIFGVMHLIAGGIVLAIGATLMGFILGFIYLKTKSLTIAIIAHMCANLSDFILELLPNMNTLTIIIAVFIFAVIMAGSLFYLYKGEKCTVEK